jgi:hypothetical protein
LIQSLSFVCFSLMNRCYLLPHLAWVFFCLITMKQVPVDSSPCLQIIKLEDKDGWSVFELRIVTYSSSSPTQWYRYTPEIFLFTTATFKYTYRAPLRRIGQEYQRT